jgi:hypothetical protein
MEMKEVTEKQWLAGIRQKLADKLSVDPAELHFSPSKRLVACVRLVGKPPKKPPRHPPPRRWQIQVLDPEGVRKGVFSPVTLRGTDEPPKDFRFLREDRLIYEVAQPPPPPPPKLRKRPATAHPKAAKTAAADPPLPQRLFIIQPVERRQRRVRCEGVRFSFTAERDHLVFVAGKPEAGFVSVDGLQVYPRRGRSIIASDPAWSRDGRSLAFVETPAQAKPRLVLLAEFDNPTGDTTWELPATANLDGARVFWSGSSKLVVGKSATHPLFSTSFVKEKPSAATERYKNAGP